MKSVSNLIWGILFMSALASTPALAATFVYVSNAEDGEIAAYAMQPDGTLKALARTQVAKTVEVNASHVAYMSHPKETAKLIEEAATSAPVNQ